MRYDRALRHTSSVWCQETFHSIFAVILPLVRSNSWNALLTVPNELKYSRLETNLGIGLVKEGCDGHTVGLPRINTRGDHVLQAMAPHTISPGLGAVCRCKANARLRRSPRGLHTQARLSSLLDSSLKTTWFHSAAVQFPRALHWLGVKGSTRNGRRDPKCPSARRLRMAREETGAPIESATCAWMAADEAVGCTCAFLTMWRSSR
ncbi:uncharacterized protein TNCV_3935261 [Trichonephila clavipes]|nr:uncharacterized protein TNCV_3935261 [Trichonephila clavipes]